MSDEIFYKVFWFITKNILMPLMILIVVGLAVTTLIKMIS